MFVGMFATSSFDFCHVYSIFNQYLPFRMHGMVQLGNIHVRGLMLECEAAKDFAGNS